MPRTNTLAKLQTFVNYGRKKFYNIGPRRKRELSEVVPKTSDKDENPDSIQTTADYYEATDILVPML